MAGLAFAPPSLVSTHGGSLAGRADAQALPPLANGTAVRERIAAFLDVAELIVLTSLSEAGWPVTHCMHFGTVTGDRLQPVIYMFSKPDTRKLVNVAANPRVSLMVFAPQNVADASNLPRIQMRGICSIVEDKSEHKYSMECQFGKVGYGFSRLLGLHKQPALRVDVDSAIWTDPADPAGAVSIDYLQQPVG